MNIFGYRINNSFGFKGMVQDLPENPSTSSFIRNITLNTANKTIKMHPDICILPSGSWITNVNYDPALSDHDITLLIPKKPYPVMEAETYDIKEFIKKEIIKKLETHKIKQKAALNKILPSINIFPTPLIKDCFDSYQQFRDFTNLKLSLHNTVDPDTGLWKMKGLLTKHFENEGILIYSKDKGSLDSIKIKDNKSKFFKVLSEKDIYMPKDSTLYNSQKLEIINEFIDKLKDNPEMNKKSFFKYLERVRKFFFTESNNDLFPIVDDARKNTQKRFEKYVKEDLEFQELYKHILTKFDELKGLKPDMLPEQFQKESLKLLLNFKDISTEILRRPTLRGF